jgi:hypothetical protein
MEDHDCYDPLELFQQALRLLDVVGVTHQLEGHILHRPEIAEAWAQVMPWLRREVDDEDV